ncbi:NAD(P)H-dependent oxidoreductase [Actinoallomurus sp. NPDC050550]|uniref:NAD(P)H-dependent oxidoreductase n=1 Tax=Actinoallomurus sp. NPDC050550 TaxID=3154937 RepID=UPI0033ECC7A8
MTIPCLTQREDQQQLEWIGGSICPATSSSALPADGTPARLRGGTVSPVSPATLCAGVDYGRPTRLLADQITESVCGSLAASGVRVEVEVLELRRLAADLAQRSTQGRASLDLREAIAAIAAADGLVVATPVLVTSPGEVCESFLDVLESGVLSSPRRSVGIGGDRHHLLRI